MYSKYENQREALTDTQTDRHAKNTLQHCPKNYVLLIQEKGGSFFKFFVIMLGCTYPTCQHAKEEKLLRH